METRSANLHRRMLLFCLVFWGGGWGCGAQLSGGPMWNSGSRPLWGSVLTGVRLTPVMGPGVVFSGHGTFSVSPSDRVIVFRSGVVGAGFSLPPRRIGSSSVGLGLEATGELGIGQPSVGWGNDALGVYVGSEVSGLLRLAGPSEPRPRIVGAAITVDMVLSMRAGFWNPQEGFVRTMVPEVQPTLGLRMGVVTDLLGYEPAPRRP